MLILSCGGGCKKSASEATKPQSQATNQPSTLNPQPATTIARIHWLGKQGIAAQKTSSRFMSLWNMPEAARLENQTLDKLALAIVGDQAAEARLSGISNQPPVTSGGKSRKQKIESRKWKADSNKYQPDGTSRKSQIANRKSEGSLAPPAVG